MQRNKCDARMEIQWVGVGGFSKLVTTFSHVGGSFIYGHQRGCLNYPIFPNLGLCVPCCAHFMCHHELWPTPMSHDFSFPTSSLVFAGGKHYQKVNLPIFRLVLKNFAIQGCSPYILSNYYISPYYLPKFTILANMFVCRFVTCQN